MILIIIIIATKTQCPAVSTGPCDPSLKICWGLNGGLFVGVPIVGMKALGGKDRVPLCWEMQTLADEMNPSRVCGSFIS